MSTSERAVRTDAMRDRERIVLKPTIIRPMQKVVLALGVAAAVAAGSATPARGGVGVGVGPTYPAVVVVGDTNVAASIFMANTSTAPESGGTLTLSLIRHTPSCGTDTTPCPAGSEDLGVFLVKGTLPGNKASGRAGTACAGMTFTIGPPDGTTGEVEFVPDSGSVVLNQPGTAGDSCAIDFLVDVLSLPTKDAGPGPSIQTDQLGRVTGTASFNSVTGTGTGSGMTTVQQPTPTPTTTSTATVVPSATVTQTPAFSPTNTPTPLATVTSTATAPPSLTPTETPTVPLTNPAGAQITSALPASILIFPKVEADGVRDTVIHMANASNILVNARCFYVRGDDQSCSVIAFGLTLTKQQPTHWVVSQGRPQNSADPHCSPANSTCDGAGLDPGPVPPAPSGFRGELLCVQVDASAAPLAGNSLVGDATLAMGGTTDIAKYNAIGLIAFMNSVNNTLLLDGVEYAACPASWSLNHVAEGSEDELAGTGSTTQTILTAVPCSVALNTDPATATGSDLAFTITNEFETTFVATTTVSCWTDIPLSAISSAFDVANLGSLYARTTITPLNAGVILVAEELRQPGPSTVPAAEMVKPHGAGTRPTADRIDLP